MHFTTLTILILHYFASTLAVKEVVYSLNISYFEGRPDGVPKQILGINSQFPGPTLRASRYDILTITVNNQIQDGQTTTIHWHGLEQFLTPWQDGPRMLMQCDIPTNDSYTYRFQVNQTGTYWYHSHHTSQYGEGVWGVLIVDNTPEVYNYDGEFVFTISDWFHIPHNEMVDWYHNTSLSRGGKPYPDSSLINGAGYYPCEYANAKNMSCDPSFKTTYKVFEVERGKTYRFRVVNPATMILYFFGIDGHKLETIETDGVDTIRVPGVDVASISTGSRTSFLVEMNGDLDQYWIRAKADLSTFKLDHPNINPFPEAHKARETTFAVLRYKTSSTPAVLESRPIINKMASQGRPERHDMDLLQSALESGRPFPLPTPSEVVNGFEFYPHDPVILPSVTLPPFPTTAELDRPIILNYMNAEPVSGEKAPSWVNQTFVLTVPHMDDPAQSHKTGFNNLIYNTSSLDKPGFIKMLRNEPIPDLVPYEISGFGPDYVVEIIFNDFGDTGHPFHLHGHTFWVMGRGGMHEGPFVEERDRPKLRSGVRKETMAVFPGSWVVFRFRADSPGLWLLHCHMNFHFEAALGLVFIEGREEAKAIWGRNVPQETVNLCAKQGIDISVPEDGTTPSSAWNLHVSRKYEILTVLIISYIFVLYK